MEMIPRGLLAIKSVLGAECGEKISRTKFSEEFSRSVTSLRERIFYWRLGDSDPPPRNPPNLGRMMNTVLSIHTGLWNLDELWEGTDVVMVWVLILVGFEGDYTAALDGSLCAQIQGWNYLFSWVL